jgi:NADH-quinone oxidoreductase subunit C
MTIDLSVAWARRFGDEVRTEDAFGTLTVDVPPARWTEALAFARDDLTCGFFDWLTAVDEGEAGFAVVAHVYSLEEGHHLLVRTTVPRSEPRLASATGVYRGANWHERETYEMFGVAFDGHPDLRPLLLPDGFEGHPLRKEFVLAARVAKPWPGAKEPGESGRGAPSRRRMLPPGVPQDWGPAAREPAPERPASRAAPEEPKTSGSTGREGAAAQEAGPERPRGVEPEGGEGV